MIRRAGRLLAAALFGLALCLAGAAAAQDRPAVPTEIDFDDWQGVAERAENAVDAASLSTAQFESLRAQLAGWRGRFLAAENENAARIATIQGQIDALGPAPAEGETEPAVVASRRAELAGLLAEAQAPRLQASEAYNRANGLVAEIDGIIRARETEALLEAQPTPLNPLHWAEALISLGDVAGELRREVRLRTASEDRRREMREALPVVAVLAVLGLLLILRGRHWTMRATHAVLHRSRARGRLTLAFFVSFTQLLVPVLGLLMIVGAVLSTGIPGTAGSQLLTAATTVIVTLFFALWLAHRLFPADPEAPTAVALAPERRAGARRLAVLIGLFVGLTRIVETVADLPQVPPAVQGVFVLPVYVALAYLFYRLAGLLRAIRQDPAEGVESGGFHTRLLQFLTPALRLIAVAGPLLAAAGYLNAAERLMVPAALSLGLLGFLQALQVPIRDSYAALTRARPEDAAQALGPVLVNFVLTFLSIPAFALIWGVRPAQLLEIYARFSSGFSLGGARVTPGTILSVIVVFALGVLATRLLQGALKSTVLPRTRMDAGARNAITSGIGYLGFALAALFAINAGGIDLTALAWVLSALGVGIGFGLQNVVSNFVSGIILLVERPISEGDWIEVNGQMGIVKAISVRSTRIETFDKTDMIVPNADFISGTVTNWTRGNNIGRAIVTIGVAYGTDTRRVEALLMEIARGHPGVAAYPEPGVDFLGFGADSLNFRIRVILRDVNQILAVTTEINHQIAERFAAEGIEIPFAQRDIWLRNPEALRPPAEGGAT